MLIGKYFFAIEPASCQIEQLITIQRQSTQGRAVPRQNIHMTLFYLGPCPQSILDKLYEQMNAIRWPKFAVTFDALQCWSKPKIICATASIITKPLADIVVIIEKICIELGFSKAQYSYNPHLTLIRKATTLTPGFKLLLRHQTMTLRPKMIHLYYSHSSVRGVQYDIIKSWLLL